LAFWSSELTSSTEDLRLPHPQSYGKHLEPQLSDLERIQHGHSNCSETDAGNACQNDAAHSCESMGVSLTCLLL
jgi:hypothetical protein